MNKKILKIIFSEKKILGFLLVCSLMSCLAELAVPHFTSIFIDEVLIPREVNLLYVHVLRLSVLLFLGLASNYFVVVYSAITSGRAVKKLTIFIVEHLNKVNINEIKRFRTVELAGRIQDDVFDLANFCIGNLMLLIVAIVNILGVIFIISKISLLFLSMLICFIILYFSYYFYINEKIKVIYNRFRDVCNYNLGSIEGFLRDIKQIKIYTVYEYYYRKIIDTLLAFTDINEKRARISFFLSNSRLMFQLLFYLVLFLIAAKQVMNNLMTVGEFVSLIGYFNIVITTLSFFVNLSDNYQNALVASNRLTYLLDIKEAINGDGVTNKIEVVELCSISKSFGNNVLFNDFSYKFLQNKIYCITGSNGKGKSTLLDIILGLEKVDSGTITFNGIDIKNYDIGYLHKKQIDVVEQKSFILEDSLNANLCNRINQLENFGVFSSGLQKYRSLEMLMKDNLSGGEKQRISILRALLNGNNIMIMDEPTSSLDLAASDWFINYLEELKKERIVIIVSHDKRIINKADEVIDLNEDCVYA